jgi:hypothetical protein
METVLTWRFVIDLCTPCRNIFQIQIVGIKNICMYFILCHGTNFSKISYLFKEIYRLFELVFVSCFIYRRLLSCVGYIMHRPLVGEGDNGIWIWNFAGKEVFTMTYYCNICFEGLGRKLKVKLSLCLTKYHAMKIYPFLNYAPRNEDVLWQ